MNFSSEQIAYLSARTLVRGLFAAGIKDFVISPGYRNSPLVLALAKLPGAKLHSHIDERGAAFFALGLAKGSGRPAAVLCTSGTAAANYLPAVLEAFYSSIPLVVVTADRPHELIGIGANQAMEQAKLFGSHTRFFTSIPALQSLNSNLVDNISLLATKSAALSMSPAPGPVHINIAFREPFFLKSNEIDAVEQVAASTLAPAAVQIENSFGPTKESIEKLKGLLLSKAKILLAVGPGEFRTDEQAKLFSLSQKLHAPIFAEASSGLGFSKKPQAALCSRFDMILRDEAFSKAHKPDLILRYGPPLTSKAFLEYQSATKTPLVVIDQMGETRNPQYGESYFYTGNPEAILSALENALSTRESAPVKEWAAALLQKNRQFDERVQNYLTQENAFTEWHMSYELSRRLPENSFLFLSNSMPIRDFDAVSSVQEKEIRVFSNRGLSGIDGVLSTALGVAAGSGKTLTLLIGDLSTLHDINALSLAKRMGNSLKMVIFVINNQGGEIFRMVPTGESPEAEKLFTTPQSLDFSSLAAGFGIPFQRWDSLVKFREKMQALYEEPGVKLVELIPNGARNTSFRKEFWKSLKQ